MKPVLTKKGKETVNSFILNLEALRKEVLDTGKDKRGNVEIPTEEDIIQKIIYFEGISEEEFYYFATYKFGLCLTLKLNIDYIWEQESEESK